MAAILLIYTSGLLICMLSGIALRMVLDLRGRWLSHWCLPLGAATVTLILFPIGTLMPIGVGAWVYCGVLAAALLVGIFLRQRAATQGHAEGLHEALRPERSDVQILAIGAAVGIGLLVPLFSLGFPSTISIGYYDGWSRAAGIEVLRDHTLGWEFPGGDDPPPLGGYADFAPRLGAGFENLGALLATVLGKQGVEIVGPLAALAAPIAVSGWARLWEVIGGDRRPSSLQALLIAIAATAPLFVYPFTDGFVTQFFSLAQWPLAVGAALSFFGALSVRNLVVAVVAVAGVAATYPPLLPWLVPAVAVTALFASDSGELPLVRRLSLPPELRGWVGKGALALGLAACVFALAPIQTVRAINSAVVVGGNLEDAAGFPSWDLGSYLLLLAGAVSEYELPQVSGSVALWPALPLALVVAAIAGLGIVVLRTSPSGISARLLAIGGVTLAVTAYLFVKYKYADGYPYGTFKALASGGALLAGLLVITLAGRTQARLWPVQVLALAGLAAIWLPTTGDLLQRQTTGKGSLGFREEDRALAEQIEALPPSSMILVEGAAETPNSYRLRMTTSYYAEALERPIEGVGTTRRYGIAPAGTAWLPTRPWSYVVSNTEPLPFGADRGEIWRNDLYRISEAPTLDVTPYDLREPCAPAESGAAAPAGRSNLNWLAGGVDTVGTVEPLGGPAELVVSNRSPDPAVARLTMRVESLQVPRRVTLSAPDLPPATTRIVPGRPRLLALDVPVDADSTAVVSLRVEPCNPAPPARERPTPLIRVRDVRVGPPQAGPSAEPAPAEPGADRPEAASKPTCVFRCD